MEIQSELIKIGRVAEMLDAPVKTVRRWIFERKIPYHKLPSGAIRFHIAEVRQWYNSSRVAPLDRNVHALGIETERNKRST